MLRMMSGDWESRRQLANRG